MTPDNALYRTAALCSRSEQCEADLRDKLSAWGIAQCDANAIIARLKAEGYIDEQRYARAFVRDKFRFGGWGRIKIAYALRHKRVGSDTIDAALGEIDETEYHEALRSALSDKLRSCHAKEPLKLRAALYRFAASRGYEPAIVSEAVSAMMKSHGSSCSDDYPIGFDE